MPEKEKIESNRETTELIYDTIIEVPYCALQHLLKYEDPIAYTTSIYGWDSDIYDFSDDFKGTGGVCICTGYRPFGNVPSCTDMNKLYDSMAKEFECKTEPELREEVLHELVVAYIKVTLLIDESTR